MSEVVDKVIIDKVVKLERCYICGTECTGFVPHTTMAVTQLGPGTFICSNCLNTLCYCHYSDKDFKKVYPYTEKVVIVYE
jgi:hypothetical protein